MVRPENVCTRYTGTACESVLGSTPGAALVATYLTEPSALGTSPTWLLEFSETARVLLTVIVGVPPCAVIVGVPPCAKLAALCTSAGRGAGGSDCLVVKVSPLTIVAGGAARWVIATA
mmetsp:Transcript_68896/g.129925  ORF Transcript_68896/g.129925 Transcript_68896/m.129925 type:complete len:118 (-) Transcript_68896:1019-1372(-)